MALTDSYRRLIETRALEPDADQAVVVDRMNALAETLLAPPNRSLFARPRRARGIYLYGDVGRGKSMLMDLFFAEAQVTPKRRIHFNAFMTETHERIHAWRRMTPRERARRPECVSGAGDDPIAPAARRIALEARLLCFDEFQVTDVADAMILGRLFERLFASGITIVLTSNTPPGRLYEGGLNRQLFLPFIALIERRLEVVALNGPRDYRLENLSRMPVYLTPPGAEAEAAMNAAWFRVTGAVRGDPAVLNVQGREFRVPQAARGAVRFTFEDLCAQPRGAADYLALARTYHTLFLDRIPVFTPALANEARRFTLLIDTLYDEHVKLVCSAAAAPGGLYAAGDNGDGFRRTASRLAEMQCTEYLGLAHGLHEIVQARHDD